MKENVHEGEGSQYVIPLFWDKHDFNVRELEINQKYLDSYPSSVIDSLDVFLRVSQRQISGSIELNWFLDGTVNLECDTCLEPIAFSVRSENTFYIKQHPKGEAGSDEVDLITVLPGEIEFDLVDLISETIHIQIPIQVTCEMDAYNPRECNAEITKFIAGFDDEVSEEEGEHSETEETEANDPRWEALKKIQFKNTEDGTSET